MNVVDYNCNGNWRTCGHCKASFGGDSLDMVYPSCDKAKFIDRLFGSDNCPYAPNPENYEPEEKPEKKEEHKMTIGERGIVFNYSKLCSVAEELRSAASFFGGETDEKTSQEIKDVQKLIYDASQAVEKAQTALEIIVNRHTDWDKV